MSHNRRPKVQPLLPGVYRAQLVLIEDVERKMISEAYKKRSPESGPGPFVIINVPATYETEAKWRWTFNVQAGKRGMVKVTTQTSQKIKEDHRKAYWKTNPVRYVEAILDGGFPWDVEFEWEDFYERWCNVT
jgi:hypothetical protein